MGWGRQIGASPPSDVVDLADRGSHSSRCTTTTTTVLTHATARAFLSCELLFSSHTREREQHWVAYYYYSIV